MEFEEIFDVIETINEATKDEIHERMIMESFGSWQIIEVLKGMLGSKAKALSFKDHIERLGLLENQVPQGVNKHIKVMETKLLKDKALQTAEEILSIDRKERTNE